MSTILNKNVVFMTGCLLSWLGLSATGFAASLHFEQDSVIAASQPRQRLPVWTWGSMVRVQSNSTAAPVISALDAAGSSVTSVEFKLPGADRITLSGFARGRDGVFVLCGWTADKSGRLAAFVASVSGQDTPRVIRTNPYFPTAIAIAEDGSLWTAGEEMTPEQREVKTDYNVLRHYDRTGTLLSSAISRFSLASRTQLSCCIGRMAASLNRVGWYTGPASEPGSEYIEIQPDGAVLRIPGVTLSKSESISGLALTDSLSLVSIQDSQAHENRIVTVDRATHSWQPVGIENFDGSLGYLYGGDGDRVVVRGDDVNSVRFFRLLP